MKRFKRLLVHLDLQGSHDSSVLKYAAAVSQLSRSERVEVVHTGSTPSLWNGFLEEWPARTAAWLHQARTELERLVQRHFRGLPGCRTRIEVLGGSGFQDLLEQLRHRNTDLVMVGKSEKDAVVAEKLARKAPCSVMVVPPCRTVRYRRILVPIDFSEHSARAMEVAVAFAKARGLKQLHCFHAYQIPYGYHKTGFSRDWFKQDLEKWARRRCQEFQQRLDCEGLEVRFTCAESPLVGPAILAQAARDKIDLLVMGARGLDAASSMLLGSTTAQVVRETTLPTLVVKPKGAGRALLDLLLGNS